MIKNFTLLLYIILYSFTGSQDCSKSLKCSFNSKCNVVGGVSKCVCSDLCPDNVEFVCGSDHKTYQNECYMKRESCQQQRAIKVNYLGVCSKYKTVLFLINY